MAISTTMLEERTESRLSWTAVTRFLGTAVQMGLLVLLVRQFEIEGPVFYRLTLLVGAGFLVHSVLPLRHRLPFFAALSVAAMYLVFGLTGSLWLFGIGSGLIALCHLPLQLKWRVALLFLSVVPLALMRTDTFHTSMPSVVWPILASMFMFRIIVYLYDLHHSPPPFRLSRTLVYFFMLPNLTMPLFPVVDYKTLVRTYYDDDAFPIYQRGLQWILRGIIHLILYRLVYHYVALDAADVATGAQVFRFLVSAFPLYLRVSGIFHIAIGTMHLFGFHLPETNHLYLLSSSFTDLWRRCNVYWKDATMKLIYYPSFFRLRKKGNLRAIALSMLLVFFATWALHSIQWFWLRGKLLFSWQDVSFYVMLGGLVLVTALREAKQGSRRVVGTGPSGWSLSRAVKTVLTIGTLSLLWSYWTSDSVAQWLSVWEVAGVWTLGSALAVISVVLAFGAIAGFAWKPLDLGAMTKKWGMRPAFAATGVMLALLVAGKPSVYRQFPEAIVPIAQRLQTSRLSSRDEARLLRGYYEKVDDNNQFGGVILPTQLLDERNQKPWLAMFDSRLWHRRDDFLQGELEPSRKIIYRGLAFSTNRWGMRDDNDYELEKPAGTYRIAMLGPSSVMGLGVADGESFEAVLERELNSHTANSRFKHYDILNFGVLKYSVVQQVMVLETKAAGFHPDLVISVYHPELDAKVASDRLSEAVVAGWEIPYPELKALVAEAGVTKGMDSLSVVRRLTPFGPQVVYWSHARMAERCRQIGARCVLLALRLPGAPVVQDSITLRKASEAGLEVLTLNDYEGRDESQLKLMDYDRHPNAEGHRFIARWIYREFLKHNADFGLGLAPDSAAMAPGSR